MKVSELFEATIPAKNKKLGYSTRAKIPTGGTKEWLKTFGATDLHISEALNKVVHGAPYREVLSLGMSGSQSRSKSLLLIGTIKYAGGTPDKLYERRMKFTVQANGKIDETAPNDYHRAPVASGKPHIVPGDPVGSIVRTMNNALEKLAANLKNRRAKEEKAVAAWKKIHKE